MAVLGLSTSEQQDLHEHAAHLSDRNGYDQIEMLDEAAGHAPCPSPTYKGGYLDMGAAHLHPPNFALGLAQATAKAGVRIFEGTEVTGIEEDRSAKVLTANGTVSANHVILVCNSYLGDLNRKVASRVMLISNFIAATEPLGDDTARVLTRTLPSRTLNLR
ncbi:Gamma-glutamylputrescine oxidoreductase [Ruegeria denitrificans]|uniref:Gamma-glutamylputrescine oxidoreductase n=1 Tax=Ruegeria denitrificans TaxID=1715692 RepID=A0A0P1I4S4_9RHOB|nr:Gamma-glutamylputrescine oxidoreductase [Ruegeria denitrificans]